MGADPSTVTGKKVQQTLKDRVHKGQEKISTRSRKIGRGVVRSNSLHLKRSSSAPGNRTVVFPLHILTQYPSIEHLRSIPGEGCVHVFDITVTLSVLRNRHLRHRHPLHLPCKNAKQITG
ncbi:hypothetical protein M404DRAFT_1006540 [Pisolithus tinctorius Marx 270]|uniref:Uncharacterized protein n=1 Tax=Pisolithus tinctorius Marx 270 TaxID=870435 RepID=A0A0C3II89_PISTI|nr:hypothetical protein M404DRAFT_1006540 [Pisolithus tinctorius Marx 270]